MITWLKDWLDWGHDGGPWEWVVIIGVIAALFLVGVLLGVVGGDSITPHPGGGLIEQ